MLFRTKTKTKPVAVAVRVEPKVFLANERTFLSWMHTAILLALLSTTILGASFLAAPNPHTSTLGDDGPRQARRGVVFLPVRLLAGRGHKKLERRAMAVRPDLVRPAFPLLPLFPRTRQTPAKKFGGGVEKGEQRPAKLQATRATFLG
ncbi:MAG: hypothetical protein BJ554DRAFT_4858 [Olpidium bornovanus]|uniref:DUF202 domain-containing protein n=1 Tax=Olpidium bornovanus TaxID=278681 RepID=A0A8H8A051_9FUNG|nr:MAG: hypothetical protein BJ554DRAFT_4858 [Olpidium bornovanus]